jgi:archaetidylinositol phosphate synthase
MLEKKKQKKIDEHTEKREKQKRFLAKLIDKPVSYLIKGNISPNILSLGGILSSFAAAIFIGMGLIHGNFFIAWIPPILIAVSGILDVFDGEVARRTGKVSPVGSYLDSNLDRISDSFIIFGLMYGELIGFIEGFFILFFMIMISYTRSRAEIENVNMKGIGFLERAERLIILIIAIVIEIYIYAITKWLTGSPFELFFPIFIKCFILALFITLGQRYFHIRRCLKK